MQYAPPAYYRPYRDTVEDDDDTASEYTATTATSDATDPRYAIIKAAGPNFNTLSDQLAFDKAKGASVGTAYGPIVAVQNANSVLYGNPAKTTQTSLFAVRSANRDQSVYPTSTQFSLKLPRVYKNVTQFQCVQISFPFFQNAVISPSTLISTLVGYILLNIAPSTVSSCLACFNQEAATTSIAFIEDGRTNPVTGTELVHVASIRNGGYNAYSLVAELNQQMNKVPPFNLITYADHYARFRATRSYDHLFNEAGPQLYDGTTKTFKVNPTKGDIMARYYPDSFKAHPDTPTDEEAFVAYFYPVLKEAVMSEKDAPFLDYGEFSANEVYGRVVRKFEGIESPLYYDLCVRNYEYLAKLRRQHTFEYYPIYNYEWYYSQNQNRVGVRFQKLHPSLTTDLTQRYSTFYATMLDTVKLTNTEFVTLQNTSARTGAVLASLHDTVTQLLEQHLGVAYGLYSTGALASPSTLLQTVVPNGTTTNKSAALINKARRAVTTPTLATTAAMGVSAATRPQTDLTFGFTTMASLVAEATNVTKNPDIYTQAYRTALQALNTASITNKRLGGSIVDGFGGDTIVATDFATLYSSYVGYTSTYVAQMSTVSTVVSNTQSLVAAYASSKYGSVFPPKMMLNRGYLQNSTDGVKFVVNTRVNRASSPFETLSSAEFDCCLLINRYLQNTYYACLPAEFVINSLAYKLGFVRPVYSNISTFVAYLNFLGEFSALPTSNTLLQVNTEQSFNQMDVAGTENYTVSNESTGQSKFILGKILTIGQDFLGVSQTIIQSPARFSPPLGRLDKLEFTMLLDDFTPVSSFFPFGFDFTNWDAVFQIDEEVPVVDRAGGFSTVPTVPETQGALPY